MHTTREGGCPPHINIEHLVRTYYTYLRIGAGAKHSVHKPCQHHRPIWQCMTLCVSIKEEYLMCFCSIVQRAVDAVDVLGSSHLCITQLSAQGGGEYYSPRCTNNAQCTMHCAQGEGEYYSPRCTNCANRNMALNCDYFLVELHMRCLITLLYRSQGCLCLAA